MYRCQGECGILYPLLVDHREGATACVACGEPAVAVGQLEMMEELRRRMANLFPDGPGAPVRPDVDAAPVSLRARLKAAEEVGEMLRLMEAGNRPGRLPEAPRMP